MRVSFVADTATFDEIEEVLVAGLAMSNGSQRYLIFQRSFADAPEDKSIYLEYNSQAYSGYNAIASCRVSRERIEVDLLTPLGNRDDVTGIDVELQVDDPSYKRFLHGLRQMFRGKESAWLTTP